MLQLVHPCLWVYSGDQFKWLNIVESSRDPIETEHGDTWRPMCWGACAVSPDVRCRTADEVQKTGGWCGYIWLMRMVVTGGPLREVYWYDKEEKNISTTMIPCHSAHEY